MNNGISGYNAGRINPYRQLENGTGRSQTPEVKNKQEMQPTGDPSLGTGLSEAEARMIHQNFPRSEQMTLKLYGPGSESKDVNPNGVGQRIDLRG